MTRKILVAVISITYMTIGLFNVSYSLFSSLSSSGLFVIKLFPLVGGALALHAGLNMFRLNEFGRIFVIALLSIRVVINLGLLFYLKDVAGLGIVNNLGELTYKIENRYTYPSLLFVWIVIALLTIAFLSQRETKKIFEPETTENIDPTNFNSDKFDSDIFI